MSVLNVIIDVIGVRCFIGKLRWRCLSCQLEMLNLYVAETGGLQMVRNHIPAIQAIILIENVIGV